MTIRLRVEQLNPGDEFIYQECQYTLLDYESRLQRRVNRAALASEPEWKLVYIPGGSVVVVIYQGPQPIKLFRVEDLKPGTRFKLPKEGWDHYSGGKIHTRLKAPGDDVEFRSSGERIVPTLFNEDCYHPLPMDTMVEPIWED